MEVRSKSISIGTFAKAIYAAILAGLGSLEAVLNGGTSVTHISAAVWVTIATATLLAGGGVYSVTNAPGA